MGMQINTNLAAHNTYRNLNATQNDLSKCLEKLSQGLRINRAADDAAGLVDLRGPEVAGRWPHGRRPQRPGRHLRRPDR